MPLRFMLDTNICIYIAKKKPISVLHKFEHLAVGEIGMSVITYGELLFGAEKSQTSKKTLLKLDDLISLIPPLPLSIETGKCYGKIRSQLEKQGKPIGNNDLWIASHAIEQKLILVSNNTHEFSRIPQLKLENWVEHHQS